MGYLYDNAGVLRWKAKLHHVLTEPPEPIDLVNELLATAPIEATVKAE